MTKTAVITLACAALLALTVTAAYARHGGIGGGWAGGPGPMGHIARHLDLQDEQREEIRAIMRETRDEAKELREQMRQLRSDIADSIRTSGFDADQVRLMLENRSSLMIDAAMVRIEGMARIYSALTPEQQAKADALMEQRRNGWRGKRWHDNESELPPADL